MKVNSLQKGKVKPHDFAMSLVPQLSAGIRFDVLLVADAPVDVPGSDHRLMLTLLSGPAWLRDLGTLLPAWISQCWVRPMLRLGSVVEVS